MGRILAIDYGRKRVGIAVTDPLQLIASPLQTIDTPKLIPFLVDYVKKEKVDELVVGFPKKLDNTFTTITQEVLDFAKKLELLFSGKKIHLWDERFTSSMALQALIQSGVSKKMRKDKAMVDKLSATILLQSFLEKKQ